MSPAPGNADYTVFIVDSAGQADMSVAVVGDQVVDLSGGATGDVLTIQPDGSVAPAAPSGASVDSWLHVFLAEETADLADDTDLVWNIAGAVDNSDGDVEILADVTGTTGKTLQFNTAGRYDLYVNPVLESSVGAEGSLGLTVRAITAIPMLNILNGAIDVVFSGGNHIKVMQPLWIPSLVVAADDQVKFKLLGSVIDSGTAFLKPSTDLYVRRVA